MSTEIGTTTDTKAAAVSTTTTETPEEKAAKEYLGMTKKSAQDRAEGKNMVFRLISIDGEPYFSWPTDQRTDRVCVEIEKGKIVVSKIC